MYIRTPLENKSQTIPHMVEHCVGRRLLHPSDFFGYDMPVEKSIDGEWTKIYFDNWISVEDILKEIKGSLLKEIYEYEKEPFKEECNNMDQGNKMFEAMIQKLFDPSIILNTWKGKTWKDVVHYHKKYYKEENILIYDDNVNREEEYSLIMKGASFIQKSDFQNTIFSESFEFNKDEFIFIGVENYDAKSYRYMVFIWILLDSYCVYWMRRSQQKYFYDGVSIDSFRNKTWITAPKIDYNSLKKDFFEEGKKYIINLLEDGYYKQKLLLSSYLDGIPVSRRQIIDRCKSYSWSLFSDQIGDRIIYKTN